MSPFKTPKFNHIIKESLQIDVETIKLIRQNIRQIRQITEKLGFEWHYTNDELDDIIDRIRHEDSSEHWGKPPYIVATKTFSNGYKNIIQLHRKTHNINAYSLTIEYPSLRLFLKSGSKFKWSSSQYTIYNSSLKDTDFINIEPWELSQWFRLDFRADCLWCYLDESIEPLGGRRSIQDLPELYEIIEAGIPYDVWIFETDENHLHSNFKMQNAIDFMLKLGMAPSIGIKMKLANNIPVDVKDISDETMIDLL